MRKKIVVVVVFLIGLVVSSVQAQNSTVSIRATAVVMENLQMITVRDMDLVSPPIVENRITVNPISSTYAGLFKILGSPNARIRINYTPRETLLEQNEGIGIVQAVYSLSAAPEDNQAASFLLTQGDAEVSIGQQGVVFLWLGAELDISQATMGNYVSEFVLEFEYI
ncbi:hypothetical protein ACFPIK_15430 [Algoriphagus aquatilis]|uniref:DUF4402 domain-containing protein n=1 Tax=Algoriphagus aquatilis TaxID=490186 RepID=A0ABW0BZM9_9BACT